MNVGCFLKNVFSHISLKYIGKTGRRKRMAYRALGKEGEVFLALGNMKPEGSCRSGSQTGAILPTRVH